MLFNVILVLLIVFFLFILFYDLIIQVNTWQGRIRIGHFPTKEWHHRVLKNSLKWLKRTPKIPITDQKRLIVIDRIKGNYKRSAIQSWQEAALVLGLSEYERKSGNPKVRAQLENFVGRKINASGCWIEKPIEADHAMLGYAFMKMGFIDHFKHRPAFDETYNMILALKGNDGTVAYKPYKKDFRFVDTIGFICPFLVKYGVQFNIPEAVDLAIKQINEYQKYGMMVQENIPCHSYEVASKIPTGLFGWGRGLGWYVLGLADSWQALPINHPAIKDLEALIIKTVHSAVKFQEANGGFHWLLFDRASRLDSSTAATLAWFFSVGETIPEISSTCKAAKDKALKYLESVTRRNGAIDFSQGDTKGIGVYSQNFDILPFTQGLCLRTLANTAE